jgi:hypothetical protein
MYHGTNEVVQQLGLNCKELITVNLMSSPEVTDISVQYLLKLKKLKQMNVSFTSISYEGYQLLISQLPRIGNVIWPFPIDNILDGISAEILYKVRYFRGCIQNTNILTQML